MRLVAWAQAGSGRRIRRHGPRRLPVSAGSAHGAGELEAALLAVTQERVRVAGAGRTDAGVHALGQVASFVTTSRLVPEILQRALNAVLPDDVAVLRCREVPDAFHARFSAQSREYFYVIINRPERPALRRRRAHHVPLPLDETAMDEACRLLVGKHDFAAFCGAGRARRRCAPSSTRPAGGRPRRFLWKWWPTRFCRIWCATSSAP